MEFARNATAVEIKETMDFALLLTLPRVVHLLEKNHISDGNAAGGIGVTEITHPYQSALARVRLLVLLIWAREPLATSHWLPMSLYQTSTQ